MKVHGKDAVCQYDSEESEGEEEASSPTSSLPSQNQQDWYCAAPPSSLPTPPSDHTSPGHTGQGHTQVKFESHHHSIGGLIGGAGY